MKTKAVVALAALALSGCASIFSGSSQEVAIRTTPGAKFAVTNAYGTQVASGESSGTVDLKRGAGYFSPQAYQVKLSKQGYRSRVVDIVPGINPWYFGNLVFGAFVGMVIVDPLTGAMYKLLPNNIDAELEPIGQGVAELEQEHLMLEKSGSYSVSRHDYTARSKAREMDCAPMGSPAVDGLNTPEESITFLCKDGRQLTMQCRSGRGCSAP